MNHTQVKQQLLGFLEEEEVQNDVILELQRFINESVDGQKMNLLNIVGFWTVGQTQQDIRLHHLRLNNY